MKLYKKNKKLHTKTYNSNIYINEILQLSSMLIENNTKYNITHYIYMTKINTYNIFFFNKSMKIFNYSRYICLSTGEVYVQ